MRIIHQGLGNIGLGIARLVLDRGHPTAAAVRLDPAAAGQDLGALLGAAPLGVEVTTDAAGALRQPADILIHCTGSRVRAVLPQLEAAVEARLDVVSTCEELAYPWYHHPEEARRLDDLARRRGVTVVGLGVNPGFVMDALPIMLTAPCRDVTRITAERVVDVSQRRAALAHGRRGDDPGGLPRRRARRPPWPRRPGGIRGDDRRRPGVGTVAHHGGDRPAGWRKSVV